MEQIGRLFINAQQLRQIPQLLESAFPTLPCTVKLSESQSVRRKRHIHTGYRQTDQSWRYYFLTSSPEANERTINVWTPLYSLCA
ncbi:hypothetical protein OJAV_G00156140 [Oryzias javanicus]|uniref:Uncharacterized protein n=1 Tax=Oryzias javanicus TaxID=123683 RepID=A0A437CI85_ORYJA|nr:hypothetical protein OJAV_G00156140 [Oryzias javanicus]